MVSIDSSEQEVMIEIKNGKGLLDDGKISKSLKTNRKTTALESFLYLDSIRSMFATDTNFFCPSQYSHIVKSRLECQYYHYDLAWYQRLFVTFEISSSSILANIIYTILIIVIIISITVNVMGTLPEWRAYPVKDCIKPACHNNEVYCPSETICEPTVDPLLDTIDTVCVIIFTIDYICRLGLCSTVPQRITGLLSDGWDEEESLMAKAESRECRQDPENPPWYVLTLSYMFTFRNFVDLVAILPFYVTLIYPNVNASLSFMRIFRLLRVVRAFGGSGGDVQNIINMLQNAVGSSMHVISFILIIGILLIFIYGSIIFDLELGDYIVSDEYPNGAYVRTKFDGSQGTSPFRSSISGMYWAVVTMTTVGYGDIVPISVAGQFAASSLMILGILFMALPIAILGSKVTLEYSKLDSEIENRKREEQRKALSKRIKMATGVHVSLSEGDTPETSNVNSSQTLKNFSSVQSPNTPPRNASTQSIMRLDTLSENVCNAGKLLKCASNDREKNEVMSKVLTDLQGIVVQVKSELEFSVHKCEVMADALNELAKVVQMPARDQ